ncbi:MAG: hypothetical protein JWL83_1879, partial [Actinomycetia bacterium]|nr:hypothetical protein [Actinomycetes bacterium]
MRSMGERVATTVWTISSELILALDEHLGTPIDSYVNGSQTWLTPAGDAEAEIELEWRLHPVAGYHAPKGLSHYDLWEQVVHALSGGEDPHALKLGEETRPLTSLWDGLECYAPYDDLEPVALTTFATDAIGRAPDRSGLVDHEAVGDAWERSAGKVSLVAL